jgi:hypothetical protein
MRIAFYSTMGGLPWGGSEELWHQTALVLLQRGHQVVSSTRKWKNTAAPMAHFAADGGQPHYRGRSMFGRTVRRKLEKFNLTRQHEAGWLKRTRPDLVLISLSCHTDDPQVAVTCRQLGIPYAILLHIASPYAWVANRWFDDTRADFEQADRCYFVSAETRDIMEANLATELAGAEIVDNPLGVRVEAAPAWASNDPT